MSFSASGDDDPVGGAGTPPVKPPPLTEKFDTPTLGKQTTAKCIRRAGQTARVGHFQRVCCGGVAPLRSALQAQRSE